MTYFAVEYLYRADADVAAVRPEHRAYLATLKDGGFLKASGPYVGTDRDRALLIFNAQDEAKLVELLDADPMSINDIIETRTITEWNPVLRVFD